MEKDIKIILSIDIETSGYSFKENGILSIGASIQTPNSIEIDSFEVNISLPEGRTFGKETYEVFWRENPEALERVTKNNLRPEEAMNKFYSFVEKYEKQYPGLIIVSDAPSFDIAWVNLYLSLFTKYKPLNYNHMGDFRQIWCSSTLQKYWWSIKNMDKALIPKRKHREGLGLTTKWDHDHTALNDARSTGCFYNQTIRQIQNFLDEIDPTQEKKKSKKIELAPYSDKWKDYYNTEKMKISQILGNHLIEINHIGSTSVPGLDAKPIIDMIAVVDDITEIDGLLERMDYYYKGEYNLPMRLLYGKKDDIKYYLHVHQKGNPEIKLNKLFRDYLINNPDAMNEYIQIKKLAAEKHSKEKLPTGITNYNEYKNDFIRSIIKKSGFNEVCVRIAGQKDEIESYRSYRRIELNKMKSPEKLGAVENSDASNYPLVIYRGIEIIGAAHLSIHSNKISHMSFMSDRDSESELIGALSFIEKWLKYKGIEILIIRTRKKNKKFLLNMDYIINKETDILVYLSKAF